MLTPCSIACVFIHTLADLLTLQFTAMVSGVDALRPAPCLAPPCVMLIDIDELDIMTDIVFLRMSAALHSLEYLQSVIVWKSFVKGLPGLCQCGKPLFP